MAQPAIEVYSDIHCPWAYLATYRLNRLWPEYEGRLRIVWRALALEYKNERGTPKPILDLEIGLIGRIEPELEIRPWPRADWEWPVTFWPAFEALACAQAQGDAVAFAFNRALRRAFFAAGRSPSLRHELLAVARDSAEHTGLDVARFEADWDAGRYKQTVIEDSRRGWDELKVQGSPTFVLPDGSQVFNPAAGHAELDLHHHTVRSYTPYDGDPLAAYRDMLDRALSHRFNQ